MATALSLLLLLCSASLVLSSGMHYSYVPVADMYQADSSLHKVVTLQTDDHIHECSGYCTFRTGAAFGPEECAAFFIKAGTMDCHLVPNALKDITTAMAGEAYYKKDAIQAV